MTDETEFQSIWDALESSAGRYPEKIVCLFEDRKIKYRQLSELALLHATALHRMGIGKGDRIFAVMPTSPEMLFLFFAVARLGAIISFANPDYEPELLVRLLQAVDPKLVILDDDNMAKIPDDADLSGVLRIRWPGDVDLQPGETGVRHLTDGIVGADLPDIDLDPADPIQFIFTSGTTGLPKACILSHRSRLALCGHINRSLSIGPDDRMYGCLPNYHGNVHLSVLCAVIAGGSFALSERFSASRYWDDVRAFEATVLVLHLVPSCILLNAPPSPTDTDHKVRALFTIGGRIGDFINRFGIDIAIAAYGATEAGGLLSMSAVTREQSLTMPQSYGGKVRDDVIIRIVDENGQDLPEGETGEILAAPCLQNVLFSGYLAVVGNAPTPPADGWHRTGDLGRLEPDGSLHFLGRAKEAIRVKGAFVPVEYLESLIRKHDAIEECALVGVPSPLGEQDIKAFVKAHAGRTFEPSELIEYLRPRVPKFMLPSSVELVAEFPRSPATMKIQKNRLIEAGTA